MFLLNPKKESIIEAEEQDVPQLQKEVKKELVEPAASTSAVVNVTAMNDITETLREKKNRFKTIADVVNITDDIKMEEEEMSLVAPKRRIIKAEDDQEEESLQFRREVKEELDDPVASTSAIINVTTKEDITEMFREKANAKLIASLYPKRSNSRSLRKGAYTTSTPSSRTFASTFSAVHTKRQGDFEATDCKRCKKTLKVKVGQSWESRMKTSVMSHVRNHMTIMPFHCEVCEFTCNYFPSISRHMDMKHPLQKDSFKDKTNDELFIDEASAVLHECFTVVS